MAIMTLNYGIRLSILMAVFTLLNACGDSTEKDTNFIVDESKLVISTSAGLSKSFDDALVLLTAPANAVTIDTSFIFSKAELDDDNKALNIVSPIYTFSPQNLAFDKPLNFTISVADSVETNQQLSIVQLIDGQWQALESSTPASNTVTTQISSFGTFAVQARTLPPITKTVGPECKANQATQSIRFIHVADLHARFGFKEQYFSKIKSYHNKTLSEQPYTLFTNGGDDYEKGTVAEQTSMGEATLEAIKAMAFDVRVIGNHDYAWGPEQLLKFSDDDNAIVLASNTQYEADTNSSFAGMDFSIVKIGCIKVGFFGMTSVPWNELDEPIENDPIPDFIANFKMNWQWQEVAENIVNQYRQDVDYMVMLSHLGEGTDTRIAGNVAGIDLVLGGHTHGGETYQQLENGSIVIQPNFFAQGLTDLSVEFDLTDNAVKDIKYNTIVTNNLSEIDTSTQTAIEQIMGRYAPDANTEIAVSENYPSNTELTLITAKATQQQFSDINAVLLDPNQVQDRWLPGTLTQEDFHAAFKVERQPSNTPSFNSLYRISVNGTQLKNMLASQPDWVAVLPDKIDNSANYNVALFKGAALNTELFFSGVATPQAEELAESWWLLDNYARFRTSQCLYIDSDKQLNSCIKDDSVTVWNFNNLQHALTPDSGLSELSYFDPEQSNWAQDDIQFATTADLGIADLPDGPANVLAFSRFSPVEGLQLKTNIAANGDFEEQGLLSDYTLVMDILWPEESMGKFRALLQTDLTNLSDADLFFNKDNGIGIATRDSGYFGSMQENTWHRIAFVFYAAPSSGALKVYVDGQLVGVKDEGTINERWAIDQAALLLTDNDYDTNPGYLNAILFAGRAMTDGEIESLAGAQNEMTFNRSVRQLNQVVERHYQAAPYVNSNPWLQQRSKFFNKNTQYVN